LQERLATMRPVDDAETVLERKELAANPSAASSIIQAR
jgi:hypothetical protein